MSNEEKYKKLEQISKLKKQGVLSNTEFEKEKQRITDNSSKQISGAESESNKTTAKKFFGWTGLVILTIVLAIVVMFIVVFAISAIGANSSNLGVFLGILLGAVISGVMAELIAQRKHRVGFWWGLFLGIFGIIIVALLPEKAEQQAQENDIDSNAYEQLERIGKLKKDGAITEYEFEQEKERILQRINNENKSSVKKNKKSSTR